jgi:hypothetical protein
MSRDEIARWLLEKLLSSFVISVVIIYGPIIGFNIQTSGLGTTYSIVTTIALMISLLVNILIPKDFGISRRLKKFIGISLEDEEKQPSPK